MVAVNYSELRAELKSLLDKVEHDNELVEIGRASCRERVLLAV
jgi:PHD/YefM family antitoxin component YafN of YafNO toxin-antitoxin module